MKFFIDYKELVRKIETKEISGTETVNMVNEYNAWRNNIAEDGSQDDELGLMDN